MCGIAGYKGSEVCEEVLLSFLEKLEYRGYDSAGVAIQKDDIDLIKNAYKIKDLKKEVQTKTTNACGIAHTRWATHGKSTKENAHPHYSQNKTWYMVHNGIIENFHELKSELKKKNVLFSSSTDSEVVPQLLEYYQVKNIKDFIDCFKKIVGTYAICAMQKDNPNLYLAKYKNPLYIATLQGNYYIASDPICFDGITNEYYSMKDNEFCEVCDNNLVFYNKNKRIVNKKPEILNAKYNTATKQNFSTFMEKEIYEIPQVFSNIFDEYSQKNYFLDLGNTLSKATDIAIIGCGTAYHSGLIGATYIQSTTKKAVTTYLASEFISSNPIIKKDTAYIFVSQSGETADTLNACELVQSYGCPTIALTNVTYSTLAKTCDVVLPVFAGREIAVASTKAYNAQLLIFYMLAQYLKHNTTKLKLSSLKKILKIDISSLNYFKQIFPMIKDFNKIFLLGKYTDYFTAMEGALKIKEITYTNTSALACGELKHGTLALIDENATSFIVLTHKKLEAKIVSAINEIKARLGKVIVITPFNSKALENICDLVLPLPELKEDIIDIVSVIPFQLFSLQLSLHYQYNPDQPKNLAKSVTVE